MTALPPEERPPGRPASDTPPSDTPSLYGASGAPGPSGIGPSGGASSSRRPSFGPTDEVFELLASVVAFQASLDAHELRHPGRGHPLQSRRWRREHEVLMLQRQMLRLRIDALPPAAYAPFPRPCV